MLILTYNKKRKNIKAFINFYLIIMNLLINKIIILTTLLNHNDNLDLFNIF